MGVMSCGRRDCEEIMCHTCVNSTYICRECQDEFKKYLEINDITVTTNIEISKELEKFMDTDKDSYIEGEEISVDEFFDEYTNY